VCCGLILGGCSLNAKTNKDSFNQNKIEITGEISAKSGEDFILNNQGETTTITSTKIDLNKYFKRKVTVKGMFSGTTLYVDEIN
ncbi:MAG TPA: hypothetical protein VF828_01280, partial [Patescibacteria group bacterium]